MGLFDIFKKTQSPTTDTRSVQQAVKPTSAKSANYPGSIGGFSGAQANLLHMASLQRGMFSQPQAMIRGVSQADIQQLVTQGIVEEIGMGYYQVVGFDK